MTPRIRAESCRTINNIHSPIIVPFIAAIIPLDRFSPVVGRAPFLWPTITTTGFIDRMCRAPANVFVGSIRDNTVRRPVVGNPGLRGTVKNIRPPPSIYFYRIAIIFWKKNVYDILVLLDRSDWTFRSLVESSLWPFLLLVSGHNVVPCTDREDGIDNLLFILKTGKNLEKRKILLENKNLTYKLGLAPFAKLGYVKKKSSMTVLIVVKYTRLFYVSDYVFMRKATFNDGKRSKKNRVQMEIKSNQVWTVPCKR